MGSDPNQLFEQFFRAKLNMKNNDINLETNRSILKNQEYLEYSPSSFCEKEMNHGTKSIPKQLDMTSTESKQGQENAKGANPVTRRQVEALSIKKTKAHSDATWPCFCTAFL